MTDNPLRNAASTLRNAASSLRNPAIGFVFSVVLIFIGYQLNSWLSRDHLSVAYVQFIPSTQILVPLADINRKIQQLRSYTVYQPTGFNAPAPGVNCQPIAASLPYDSMNAGAVLSFQRCVESAAGNFKVTVESLSKLQSDLDKNPPSAILDRMILNWPGFFRSYPPMSPEQKIQNAKRGVTAALSNSAEIGRTYDELLELAKQVNIIRTGDLTVVVTVRNTGDTDGLVMGEKNFLVLNKNPERLKIQTLGPGMYNPTPMFPSPGAGAIMSVPKRGVVTISFVLDPSLLEDPPRDAVTKLLKQPPPDLRGKVILKDTRNSDFESKEFDFPPEIKGGAVILPILQSPN